MQKTFSSRAGKVSWDGSAEVPTRNTPRQAVNWILLRNRNSRSCTLPRELLKDKVFKKDHVDTSNFMEGDLRLSVKKTSASQVQRLA